MRRVAWILVLAACAAEPEPDASRPDGGVTGDIGPTDATILDASSIDAADDDAAAQDARPEDAEPADAGFDDCALPSATALGRYRDLLACLRGAEPTSVKQGALDLFFDGVLAGAGLPIVEDGQLVFVYRRASDPEAALHASPLRAAGDFNAWDPEASPLVEEPEGFFHVALTLDVAGSERWRYKLVAEAGAQDVYFSDPLARRFDYDAGGRISIVRGGRAQGHLEDLGVFAAAGIVARPVTVYLPPGYEHDALPLPVLYLHDGNNLFSTFQPSSAPTSWEADEIFEEEISAQRVEPFIAVAIPNSPQRFDEYTQTIDDIGGGPIGGQASAYAAFLLATVKPAVDGRYRSRPGPESTAVLGSSLGGLVSYYLGLTHPEAFGCVAGMSSTFEWGTFGLAQPTLLDDYEASTELAGRAQKFYLDSGGGPGSGACPNTDDADNYCGTLRMRDILIADGFDTFPDDPSASPLTPAGIEILHWWTPDAPHHESAWHTRLFRPLRLCFPR